MILACGFLGYTHVAVALNRPDKFSASHATRATYTGFAFCIFRIGTSYAQVESVRMTTNKGTRRRRYKAVFPLGFSETPSPNPRRSQKAHTLHQEAAVSESRNVNEQPQPQPQHSNGPGTPLENNDNNFLLW